MQVSYRDTQYDALVDSRLLAQWYADPTIRHLPVPRRNEKDPHQPETAEQIQAQGQDRSAPFSPAIDLMIVADENTKCMETKKLI